MSIIKKRDEHGNEVTIYTGVDLDALKQGLEDSLGTPYPGCCIFCKEPFSDQNVFTEDGWAETLISKTCEKCFDEMWRE